MATAWELCMKLGFTDGETCSRGPSKTLLDEIQAHAEEIQARPESWNMKDVRKGSPEYENGIREMIYTYLSRKGSYHWGKRLSNGYWNLLEWPKDNIRIMDLLRELFSIVASDQPSAKNGKLVASDSDAITFAGPPEDSSASIKVEEVDSRIGASTEQRQAVNHSVQVAARPTFNSIGQVENEPGPVIASSEEHLVNLITTWMEVHPNMLLDGLRRMTAYLKLLIATSRAHPISITHGQETVQVNRFQVNEGVGGWVMKRNDGSCMLGKVTGHSRTTMKYQLWLGGERGFTSVITARKCLQSQNLFKNPDKTSGKQAAVDCVSFHTSDSFDTLDSFDTSDGSDIPLIDRRTRLSLGNGTVCPKTPEALANETKGERGRPASPVSSMRTVKRPRSSVAAPSLIVKLKSHPGRASSHNQANSRSPCPSSLPYTPRSARLPGFKTPKPKATKPPRSTPKVPLAEELLPAPKLAEPTPKKSSQTQLPLPPEPSPSTRNVLFQFFLANEEDGAIHRSLENCQTVGSFFDEAVAAWGTLGDHAQYQPCMAAAKVNIQDVTVPMVLPWRSQDSFDRMMATVLQRAAAVGQTEVLHVGVRCLAKRG